MILTIWWKNWAGKWTVSTSLAQELGYTIISIWNIKRALAQDMWLTITQFDQLWRSDPSKAKEFDLKYEKYQKSLDVQSNIILDSRLSFWCQPAWFNVFLDVDDVVGAQRVFQAQRKDDETSSLEAVLQANRTRHQWHQSTYKKLYDVDLYDMSHYDLVIDTSDLSPLQVHEGIITAFTNRLDDHN